MKQMAQPIFSVIIPAKNAERTLADAIRSVVLHNREPAEVIVIDDNSTDRTSQIAENYAKQYKNVRYFTSTGVGVSAARNTGLQKAVSPYLIFLDADDYLTSDALQLYCAEIYRYKPEMICGGYNRVTDEKLLIRSFPFSCRSRNGRDILPEYLNKTYYTHLGAICFSADFLRKNQLTFQGFSYAEDIVFVSQALSCARFVTAVKEQTYNWSLRKGSTLYTNTMEKFNSLTALGWLKDYLFSKGILNQELSDAIGNQYGMLLIDSTTTLLWMGRSVKEMNTALKERVDWSLLPKRRSQSKRLQKDLWMLKFCRTYQLKKWKKSFIPGNFKSIGVLKY